MTTFIGAKLLKADTAFLPKFKAEYTVLILTPKAITRSSPHLKRSMICILQPITEVNLLTSAQHDDSMTIRFHVMRKHLPGLIVALTLFLVLYIPIDFVFGYLRNRPKDAEQNASKETAPLSIRVPDPKFHHGLRPSFAQMDQWGPMSYKLATNQLGFKDSETRNVGFQADRYRIVFIGDSFTEGIGFPHEKTFVGVIERSLADRGVEVLNAAVVTYSPKLVFLKLDFLLREAGLRFDELAVFFDLSDAPDEIVYSDYRWDELKGRGLAPPVGRFRVTGQGPQNWYDYSLLYRTFSRLALGLDPWKQTIYTHQESGRSFPYHGERSEWVDAGVLYSRWARLGLESGAFYLDRIIDLADEFGFKVSLTIYPWAKEIKWGLGRSANVEFWEKFTSTRQIPLLNLYPAFMDPEKRKETVWKLFIPEDSHWNEAGHRFVAEQWLILRSKNPPPLPPLPGAA